MILRTTFTALPPSFSRYSAYKTQEAWFRQKAGVDAPTALLGTRSMSNEDSSVQDDDGSAEYECPVSNCEYTNELYNGVMTHFGHSHDDDVKKECALEEILRLADEFGRAPYYDEMDEYGIFSPRLFETHYGSWNAALEAAGFDPNLHTNLTEDDLIEDLQRVATQLDRTPCAPDMREYGTFSQGTYQRHFGSWNDALKAAGFPLNLRRNIPKEELVDELQRLADELGRSPSRADMNEYGAFSPKGYYRCFSGWIAALEAAGLDPTRRYNIPDEELLDELRRVGDELGRTPRQKDLIKHGEFSFKVYQDRFGGWNAALKAAGFELTQRQNIPEEELLDELRRLADELGRTPNQNDMSEQGIFSVHAYYLHFGAWNTAVEVAGLEPWTPPEGEDHPHWDGGPFPYGPGWNEAKRELVRERDNRECQQCGRSEEKHIEIHGKKHTVHHIWKARKSDDPEVHNHPDNLITLCEEKECHRKWEAMSPLRPQLPGDD